MSSTSLTQSNGSEFTWASSTFTWQDANAQKTWATDFNVNYTLGVTEDTFTTAEAIAKAIGSAQSESLSVAESIAKAFTTQFGESWATAETLAHVWAEYLAISEGWTTAETAAMNYGMALTDAWQTLESYANQYGLNKSESWSTAEAFDRLVAFSLAMSESWNNAETFSKAYSMQKSEAWATAEFWVNNYGLNAQEAWSTAENFNRTLAFLLNIAESWTTLEQAAKDIGMHTDEAFLLFDQFRQKANAIISDLKIGTADLTPDDFVKMLTNASAAGYDDFMQFIMGDYQYQDALFKIGMSSLSSDRPVVDALSVSVDVPDVFDRGTSSIATVGTPQQVTFNRTFNVPPEIKLTLKGAVGTTVGIPVVVDGSITTTGFQYFIQDPATSSQIQGTISWSAHGY